MAHAHPANGRDKHAPTGSAATVVRSPGHTGNGWWTPAVTDWGLRERASLAGQLPPDVLCVLETRDADYGQLRRQYTAALTDTQARRHRYEQQWRTLLGRDVTIDPTLAGSDYDDDPTFDRPTLVSRNLDRALRDEFASLQTVRSEFNDRIADALGLPYLASSVRLAPASALTNEHAQMLEALRAVARGIAPSAGPQGRTFKAPFLLGLLLEQMDSLSQFPDRLADLRERFARFRDWLTNHPGRERWDAYPQELTSASARAFIRASRSRYVARKATVAISPC
jgi:hypothetical protein